MTGVILAGGLGTRLRPAVAGLPKCLAPINGKPFVLHLLRQLVRAGVSRILLCTGYRAEQVENAIGSRFSGIPVLYSREQTPLGTAGALRLAWTQFQSPEPWLVMNGDSYLELNIAHFRRRVDESACIAGIASICVMDGNRFGALRYSPEGRVTAFEEKSESPGPTWINGGIYLLSPRFLEGLPDLTPLSLERDVFPVRLDAGVLAYPCEGGFIDIGLPESFAQAQTFFAP